MITLEFRRISTVSGDKTKVWDIMRDGESIAQLSKDNRPFSKYRLLAGDIYRNDFRNQEEALKFARIVL